LANNDVILSQRYAAEAKIAAATAKVYAQSNSEYADDSAASATEASGYATNAAASATLAEQYYDYTTTLSSFFIGALSAAPATRADGTAVQVGDMYKNTTDNVVYSYNSDGSWSSLTYDETKTEDLYSAGLGLYSVIEEQYEYTLSQVDAVTDLENQLASTTGAEGIGLPYGNVRNAVMYYSPEMFVTDQDSVTDWAPVTNLALQQALADGVCEVRSPMIRRIASTIYVDNLPTGFKWYQGGFTVDDSWTAFTDWKDATPMIVFGSKSNGSMVGLEIDIGFVYGADKAQICRAQGYGVSSSRIRIGRARNYVGVFQAGDHTLNAGCPSNLLMGDSWTGGYFGARVKRNGDYICEGTKVQVNFINNNIYGGLQLFNGAQYYQVYGTDADFNGKYLAELKVDKSPASDIRGSNVTWNNINYEVVDYYQLSRGNYYILVIDSQETTGGNSTIKISTSTGLTDGTTTYVISSVRTATKNQFYFDLIHGFEGSSFGRSDANFGYLGGKVGGLQRTSFFKWHNSFDENSNELNGLWVRNTSSAMVFYDKWSGLSLASWDTTSSAAALTLPGNLTIGGLTSISGNLSIGSNRVYGIQYVTTLTQSTTKSIRTFSYAGDGASSSCKEKWVVHLTGPNGIAGVGGVAEIYVGSSGIEILNNNMNGITLSASGYLMSAAQGSQSTMLVSFMFKREM